MLPKIFYRGRFQNLCAIYGARIELWPDYEQANAYAFIKHSPQKAEADMASALRLDATIKALAPSMVSEESQWQALGQLAPNTGLTAVTPEVFGGVSQEAEIEAADAGPIVVFSGRDPKPASTKPADAMAEAALEVREERARMIAQNNKKNKKLTGKGVLKFQ